ncbi:hypothetical protein ES319_A11G213300v1 [Gossypium barbadense]|uniref:Uncharacterized protein n=3 Tax=Gossypium TaxID=3633 RepID=A0A5J5TTT2_GOSBA|nr:hypothetical protein ES319_A11G213300v1 [Gossypium barbadense]KAB2058125.1 hypothetical protein ES319_A11G213300v1 [Gossypium barbadense]TYG94967.1 hypothetical protein ES288_A11G230100v1 [Gossypium darwinii]
MLVESIQEEKPFLSGMVDGSTNLPVNLSCFELIKPSLDETNQHCSLDVLPILIEETSFSAREKCSLNTSQGQDVYSISVLPEEGNMNPKCTPQLTFLSLLEVPFSSKNQMCLDEQLSCQNCIDLKVDSEDAYSSCILDINIEKETPDLLKSNDETVGNSKSEGMVTHLQKVLQRQASLNVGRSFQKAADNNLSNQCRAGKEERKFLCHTIWMVPLPTKRSLMQKFDTLTGEKSSNERVHDAPSNRWRRYKRAASFDSRKIVLLFSILSSVGTLILIYLTLRVRQTIDGFNHV